MKKTLPTAPMRITLSIVLGLIFVLFPHTTLNLIVTILGIFFVAPSLISLLAYNEKRKAAKNRKNDALRFPLESLPALLLGCCLIIIPSFFVGIFMYLLGVLLIFGGVYQILQLSTARKSLKVTPIYYLLPILILLSGIVVFINPFETSASILMLFGITSILYGVCEIIDYIKFK